MAPVTKNITHTKECSIYPGEYTLLPETVALMKKKDFSNISKGSEPLVNMEQLAECFKIEMMIPGAKREDIFIHINDNILSVFILHGECEQKKDLQIHEFDTNCTERHILLPKNTDTEFISAEYRHGILTMHIPKSHHPCYSGTSQIVVY